MNAEIIAKEFVDKFIEFNHEEFAAPHALIAVNEIIYMLENMLMSPKESIAHQYYSEIKLEIEKMIP